MKTYDFEELKKIAKEQGFKYVRMVDSDGNRLIAYNPASMPVNDRIDEMKVRLESPALKDGYYVFEGKKYLRTDGSPDKFYVLKGTPKEEIELKPEPEITMKETDVLSYDQALKLNKQVAELKAELEYCQRERDEWKLKYDDLMSEVEEIMEEVPEDEGMSENGVMSDNMQTFLSQAMENLLPVLDRHYELKEKKLQIEEGKVISDLAKHGVDIRPAMKPTNGTPVHEDGYEEDEYEEEYEDQPETEETEAEEMNEVQYNNWVQREMEKLSKTDPKRYQQVAEAANAGGDIVDLLKGGDGFPADPEDSEPGDELE